MEYIESEILADIVLALKAEADLRDMTFEELLASPLRRYEDDSAYQLREMIPAEELERLMKR